MDKNQALARIASSRQAFLAAAAELDETQQTTALVEGIWTVKDLFGHLAAWEQAVVDCLRVVLAGSGDPAEVIADHNAWNAMQASRRAGLSLAEVTGEYHAVRGELLQILKPLSEAQWETRLTAPWGGECNVAEMVSGLAWHEVDEHLQSITHWKQTGQPR